MISPATIEEIKNRIDIVDVVGDFVDLKRSGSSYKALSPFTAEKTPSFYVVPSKGIFKDFSSGKGGDAIKFVMEIDGLSYIEALKFLAKKYGIEVIEEEQTDEQLEAQNRRESLFIILGYAAKYFKDLLHKHEEGKAIGLSYFKERGFREDTIKKFDLGFSLEQWDDFYQTAINSGYSEDLLEEAGLIVKKDTDKIYDRFRNRVMFPIHNLTGKVIAFGARIMSSDKKQPKYLNSPESDLYHKSRVLYGMHLAKQAIRREDNCYLVEGYTDVISMHQVAVENVVASSGTALTSEQAKLIYRYSKNVTVLFDGDAAGTRASLRGIDILLEEDLNVKAVALPDGEDPDSYSRQLGSSAFKHYLEQNSRDFIAFKTSSLLADAGQDPIQKAEVIGEIVLSISKIGDEIKRSLYLQQCSTLLDIDESALVSELNKILREKASREFQKRKREQDTSGEEIEPVQREEEPAFKPANPIIVQERETIRLLLNYTDSIIRIDEENELPVIEFILNEIEDVKFQDPVFQKIIGIIKERFQQGQLTGYEFFLGYPDDEIQQVTVELTTDRYEISQFWASRYQIHIPNEEDLLKNVAFSNIMRLKFRIVQRMIELETMKLKYATGEELDVLLDEIGHLKKIEVQIADILGNVTVK